MISRKCDMPRCGKEAHTFVHVNGKPRGYCDKHAWWVAEGPFSLNTVEAIAKKHGGTILP